MILSDRWINSSPMGEQRLVAAIIVSGLLLTGCSSPTSKQAAGPTGTTPSSASSVTPAPEPEVTLGQWGSDSFAPVLTRIGDGFTWIGGAVKGMDFADARAGCRDLASTNTELAALLPTPSVTVDAQLQTATRNLQLFTRGCQGINASTTSAELEEWAGYRDTAGEALSTAADEVKVAQGKGG